MLQSLLLASASAANSTQSLWAVAGPNLLKIDCRQHPAKCELIPISSALGPLRSVQSAAIGGDDVLLIGAQAGVMVTSRDRLGEVKLFADRAITSSLGFNSVAASADVIWA